MADNSLQNGNDLIATDEVFYVNNVELPEAVKVQRVKVGFGLDSDFLDVNYNSPLPVTLFSGLFNSVPDNTAQGLAVRPIGQDITTCSYANVSASGSLSDEVVDLVKAASVGVSQSAGNLVITTGVTANAEYLSRSVKAWRGSWLARMKFIASQRIANQNIMFVLADKIADAAAYTILSATSVSVNAPAHPFATGARHVGQGMFIGGITGAAGVPMRATIASIPNANTIVLTVAGWPATGSGTCYLFGHSHIKALANGTNASLVSYDAQRRGWASGDSNVSSATSASPGFVFQIHNTGRDILFGEMTVSSTANSNVTSRAHRIENIPDDNLDLYLYIWSFNGTAAPATTTTWTIGFWDVEKFANIPVYIAGQRMQGTANAAPVNVTNQPTVGLATGNLLIGDVATQYRAGATGGIGGAHVVSLATTNAGVLKASNGKVIGWSLANTTAAWKYVKLHNITTAPTPGVGVVRTIAIPPNGKSEFTLEGGIAFNVGIGMTITNLSPDNDTTAVAVGDVVGDIFIA